MDLQDKIAARRRQIAQEEAVAKEQADKLAAEIAKLESDQLQQGLETIAAETTAQGFPVKVSGDKIVAASPTIPELDFSALRTKQIHALLRREARKLWTPGENWTFFICLALGLYFVPFYGVGFLGLLAAWGNHRKFQEAHKEFIRNSYPTVFGILDESTL